MSPYLNESGISGLALSLYTRDQLNTPLLNEDEERTLASDQLNLEVLLAIEKNRDVPSR